MKDCVMNSAASPTSHLTRPLRNPTNRALFDWRISVLALLLIWAAIYMVDASRPPLLDDVDSVHAEAAREMVLQNDWVTIHTNGIRYMEKAPLMYRSMAASYRIFGVGEWSTRFPLMLA